MKLMGGKTMNQTDGVVEVTHAFVRDSLGYLRNKNTQLGEFRRHSDRVCQYLFTEAVRDLPLATETIETPLAPTAVEKLVAEVVVVPIFRAGLAMLFGAMHLLPSSKVGFVGLERDEETAMAREYYWKMPELTRDSLVIITDPMLATGGSILHVLRRLMKIPVKEIRIVSVVAAPEGIKVIHQEYPLVMIFTAGVDDHLNDRAYIVPGLGDYGDRYFGTA
jgi:uracil phosphoribosyltransferase